MVTIRMLKRTLLPRKRSRANANATSEHEISTPMMFATTMIVVLIMYRRNGMTSTRTRRKLSHCQNFEGNHSGVGVKTGSRSGLRATVSIQPTGSRMNATSTSRSVYISTLCEILRAR